MVKPLGPDSEYDDMASVVLEDGEEGELGMDEGRVLLYESIISQTFFSFFVTFTFIFAPILLFFVAIDPTMPRRYAGRCSRTHTLFAKTLNKKVLIKSDFD